MKIHEPFYSDGLKGWRIEAEEEGWSDSIVVYNEARAWGCYNTATREGWYAAKRQEREINLKFQAESDAAREARREQQQQNPR